MRMLADFADRRSFFLCFVPFFLGDVVTTSPSSQLSSVVTSSWLISMVGSSSIFPVSVVRWEGRALVFDTLSCREGDFVLLELGKDASVALPFSEGGGALLGLLSPSSPASFTLSSRYFFLGWCSPYFSEIASTSFSPGTSLFAVLLDAVKISNEHSAFSSSTRSSLPSPISPPPSSPLSSSLSDSSSRSSSSSWASDRSDNLNLRDACFCSIRTIFFGRKEECFATLAGGSTSSPSSTAASPPSAFFVASPPAALPTAIVVESIVAFSFLPPFNMYLGWNTPIPGQVAGSSSSPPESPYSASTDDDLRNPDPLVFGVIFLSKLERRL
mmetsp:Transcript_41506/g.87068  ORF Transcript_41506/g.87068 Transcript_41506/m.87068 type:complete len:328 (-) Transcript_41506:24-1007(-)